MSDEYAWRVSPTKQICFLGDQSMPNHKGAVIVSELADTTWNL